MMRTQAFIDPVISTRETVEFKTSFSAARTNVIWLMYMYQYAISDLSFQRITFYLLAAQLQFFTQTLLSWMTE